METCAVRGLMMNSTHFFQKTLSFCMCQCPFSQLSKTPEALEFLKEFAWKGVIAIQLTNLKVDYKKQPTFKAKFMINVKARSTFSTDF